MGTRRGRPAVVGNTAVCRREVDPPEIRAPDVSGEGRIGYRHVAVARIPIDPATVVGPGIMVRCIDSVG
jgi:hypothetical protein